MVNTEYHLLLSIGIINRYFKENYKTTICRVSPINGSRLNNINLKDSSIEYVEIFYDYSGPNIELKRKLKGIIARKPTVFFFFLENKFWMNYFFARLHKVGTKIILGPDGMKAYASHKRSLKYRVQAYLQGLIYSLGSGIIESPPFVENRYATSKYIDEVWVENSALYNNATNKKVVEFELSYDFEYVKILNKVFRATEEDFSLMQQKTILYVDSAIKSEPYFNKAIEVVTFFQNKYPDRKIFIKLHPNTSIQAKNKYSSIKDVKYLETNYPAELYIANASDSIIVSLVSTSLLFYNPKCEYFWTYPIFRGIVNYSRLVNPTKHIKIISDLSKM